MKKTTLLMLVLFTVTLQAQTKLLSTIYQYYDTISWQTYGGGNYEYDDSNNLITSTSYSWNFITNSLENYGKISFVYNLNNKVTEQSVSRWNAVTSMFEISFKSSNSYNLSNNITETLSQSWNGSQWVDEDKTVAIYNSNNIIDMLISYYWDGLQWIIEERITLTYNVNNKVISVLEEDWNGVLWEATSRDLNTYNANNKIMTNIYEQWDGSSWVNGITKNYNYDANGNTISVIESNSDALYKKEYNYDTAILMSNLAHPFKDKTGIDDFLKEESIVNKLLSDNFFYFDNSTNSFIASGKTIHNYTSSITLSTENFELIKNNLKVFPNPSKNFIQISGLTETQNYEVYSIFGAKINKGTICDNKQIDIQNLTHGMYFLKFKNGNTIKFIKE